MKKQLFLFFIASLFIVTASAQETQSFKFKSSGTTFKLGSATSYTGEIKIYPSVWNADDSETYIIQKDVEYSILPQTEYTISGIFTSLDLKENHIDRLTFTETSNLTSLVCSNNKLSYLNVSKLTNLKSLYCNNNKLMRLDVLVLKKLEDIDCSSNKMENLRLNRSSDFKKLNCSNNKLSRLSLDNLENLQILHCDSNQLTHLNLLSNANISSLKCNNNQILDIQNQNSSLVSDFDAKEQTIYMFMNKTENGGYISVDKYEIIEGHSISLSENFSFEDGYFKSSGVPENPVTFSTNIGWGEKKVSGKIKIMEEQSFKFVSHANTFKIHDLGTIYSADLSISPPLADGTTKIEKEIVYNIQANQEYTVSGFILGLNLSGNSITSLDVSELTDLQKLYCEGNQLTSLDVSNLRNLTFLNCPNNQLLYVKKDNTPSNLTFFGKGQTVVIPMKANESGGCISENSYSISEGSSFELPAGLSFKDGYFKSADCLIDDDGFKTDLGWDNKLEGKLKISVLQSFSFVSLNPSFFLHYLESYPQITEATISPSLPDGTSTLVVGKEYIIETGIKYTITGYFPDNLNLSIYDSYGNQFYPKGCEFSSLDISGMKALKTLNCSRNFITSLNVSGLSSLKILNCSFNQLTSLNFSGLSNLEELNCNLNQLTSLDLSGLTNLKKLECDVNQITSIDVLGLKGLKYLDCYHNKLTSLDISGLTGLEEIHCARNRMLDLKNKGLSGIKPEKLYGSGQIIWMIPNSEGGFISEDTYAISEGHSLNIPNEITFQGGYFRCAEIPSEDIKFTTDIEWGDKNVSGKFLFKQEPKSFKFISEDSKFGFKYSYAFTSASGDITISPLVKSSENTEISKIYVGVDYTVVPGTEYTVTGDFVELCLADNKLSSLNVSGFQNLESLYVNNLELKTLVVSDLPKLKRLDCKEVKLESLQVTNLPKLKELDCSRNQIYSLVLTDLPELEKLQCAGNQLTNLNVSDFPNLKEVSCYNNQLRSLDISSLYNMEKLNCGQNQLYDIENINVDVIDEFYGFGQYLWIPMKADASGGFISMNTYKTLAEGHKIELPEGLSFEAGRFKCSQIPSSVMPFSTDVGWGDKKIGGEIQFERVIETPISVIKKLEGKDLLANQFEFMILDVNGWIMSTAKNSENGEFTINIPAYNEAGTYNYILKEKNDGQQGYIYDTKEYLVEIVVGLNSENVLATSITIKDGETIVETPVFTNTYIDTGINELNADSQIKLYPNPVNDILQIESLEIIKKITLSDISGKILITQQVNDTYFSLPTAQFNAGMYIIRLQTAKGLVHRKIIKE